LAESKLAALGRLKCLHARCIQEESSTDTLELSAHITFGGAQLLGACAYGYVERVAQQRGSGTGVPR